VEHNQNNGYQDNELLECIEKLSLLCGRIERATDAVVQRHGDRSGVVESARALHFSLAALKRQLLQHFLAYCIADAARRSSQGELGWQRKEHR